MTVKKAKKKPVAKAKKRSSKGTVKNKEKLKEKKLPSETYKDFFEYKFAYPRDAITAEELQKLVEVVDKEQVKDSWLVRVWKFIWRFK